MKCPNCITELKMSERSGIEIDYCPQCRGVWLDKGELDKIIERSSFDSGQSKKPISESYRGYSEKENYYDKSKDYGDANYNNNRKKKSFLGDLFDF